ncbi:alpha/beta hydrolase [Nonomuraea helvata]|uniref:Alpha/beta fold hydrolase n=1 Tax=Nonomuraea helvata TaxID=37484 RepID=A0ABV5RXI6_9ACTN
MAVAGLLIASLLAGAGAMVTIVAVAVVSTDPVVFLTAGLAVAGLLSWVTVRVLVLRRLPSRYRSLTLPVTVLVTAAVAAALLVPLPDVRLPETSVADTRYWSLPGGSRLAYVHTPGKAPHRTTPVVVLHGGPGIPDMPGLSRFFQPLAELGYDVYVYDELGAGRSARSENPRAYGIERDVADLEEVRHAIGAERMVLIGHSYGGALAAHYLAAYPTRVASLVLSSPGPLDPADTSGNEATSRLPLNRRLGTYAAALQPRALLAYALLQVNPAAAYAYFPDTEADARNDTILHLADAGLHCTRTQWQPMTHGSGFYAQQYPQLATAPTAPDVRRDLAGNPTPVLLLKGRCDYLSWHAAVDYRQVLPHTVLLYLTGAGHNTYQDQPSVVLAAVRGFLAGGPMPLNPYPSDEPPPDYQR